jgi:hypothetical protein
MPEITYLKAECQHCKGHIEYPSELGGQSVECPHCKQTIILPPPFTPSLRMPPLVVQIPASRSVDQIPPSSHHVHHTGRVTTKAHGSGVVAIGSIMCIAGVILLLTPIRSIGALLLVVGFFTAVVGRMMS